MLNTEEDVLVRASLMKDQLAFIRAHPRGEELLDAMTPALVAEIDSSSRLAWIPGRTNFDTVAAVYDRFGLREGERFYFDAFLGAWDSPLLRAVVRGGLRVTGDDPGGLVKLLPRGTELVFRGFGALSLLERSPGSAVLLRSDAPERCFEREAAWLHFEAAAQRSGISLTGRESQVQVEVDAPARRAWFRLSW